MWDATDVTDEDKQIILFVGALRKRGLAWYINFTESQNISQAEIKENFLVSFKTEDIAHLAA